MAGLRRLPAVMVVALLMALFPIAGLAQDRVACVDLADGDSAVRLPDLSFGSGALFSRICSWEIRIWISVLPRLCTLDVAPWWWCGNGVATRMFPRTVARA